MKIKQMFSIGVIIVIVIILSLNKKEKSYIRLNDQTELKVSELDGSILTLFPDTKELIQTDSSIYQVVGKNDSVHGYLIYTSPFTDDILGYGGPTPLQIAINTDKKIINVALLPENDETPDYLEWVVENGIFESWNGLTVAEALGKKVDVASGATMSSESIIETMQHRLAMINNSSFEKPFGWMKLWSNLAALLVIALAIYSYFSANKTKNLRLLLLSLSTLVLGLWQGKMLSLASDYNWLTNGINWAASWTLILILAISIVLPLISGKSFYCTYLCPYGALQELIGKITMRKLVIPEKIRTLLLRLKVVYLILIVTALLAGLPVNLANFEPFSAFAIQSASTIVLVIAGFFLGISVFISRPWCKYFCPTGTILAQFHRKKK